MMRVAELQGAHLDYWVARAEGIPAEQLDIVPIQRSTGHHVMRFWSTESGRPCTAVLRYSMDWSLAGPLIEKHAIYLSPNGNNWIADIAGAACELADTPLQAICRAVVRAKFGDEVPDINE